MTALFILTSSASFASDGISENKVSLLTFSPIRKSEMFKTAENIGKFGGRFEPAVFRFEWIGTI